MTKKIIVLALAAIGLVTFFVPLVRLRAPLVGIQRISAWSTVQPESKRARRAPVGLEESLARLEQDFLQQKRRQAPLAVRQAEALRVTLPLAYLCLALVVVFGLLGKSRLLQGSAAVGLSAAAYSLVSVFWLNSGLKQMFAGAAASRGSLMGALRRSVAQQVEASPDYGLYLLLGSLAALLLAGFLPSRKG